MNGNLEEDWQSIADRFGVGLHADTLRKAGLGVKMADQAGVLCFDAPAVSHDTQLLLEKEELYKERCKLRDERAALNKRLRDESRLEDRMDKIEDAIRKNSREKYVPMMGEVKALTDEPKHYMVAAVSDIHYGLTFSDGVCEYSPELARKRMNQYATKIKREAARYHCDNLIVVMLGDMISGSIHKTIQLQNTENVVDQVIGCSEMISDFLYGLHEYFTDIDVYGVSGNHSRMERKEDALKDERLDNLILWYLSTSLEMMEGIHIHNVSEMRDSTIAEISAGTTPIVAVHGDYDDFSRQGFEKLRTYLGYSPRIALFGHKHETQHMMCGDSMIVQCGSLCGSGDQYTVQHRLYGAPSQTILLLDKTGNVENIIPVWF